MFKFPSIIYDTNRLLEDINSSKELVELLGYLPEAICQAGIYIASLKISTKDYLKYRQAKPPVLNRNLVAAGNGLPPTSSVLMNSFEDLTKTDYRAKDLLIFCSFLAPNRTIPGNVLAKAVDSTGKHFFPQII